MREREIDGLANDLVKRVTDEQICWRWRRGNLFCRRENKRRGKDD